MDINKTEVIICDLVSKHKDQSIYYSAILIIITKATIKSSPIFDCILFRCLTMLSALFKDLGSCHHKNMLSKSGLGNKIEKNSNHLNYQYNRLRYPRDSLPHSFRLTLKFVTPFFSLFAYENRYA